MEDLVNFELAKKLKEKGFNVSCIYAYCKQGGWNKYTQKHEPITYILRTDGNPFGSFYTGKNWNKEYKTNKNKIQCSAPIISQVLKWLRKEKGIHICIALGEFSDWMFDISKIDGNVFYGAMDGFHSYEEATLAGIEYVLDNLI